MRGGVDAAADPDGGPRPRRWWDGPLDVERLAWDAVVAARDAVRAHLTSAAKRLGLIENNPQDP